MKSPAFSRSPIDSWPISAPLIRSLPHQIPAVDSESGHPVFHLGVAMDIAVVDAGANFKAFARRGGAWLGNIDFVWERFVGQEQYCPLERQMFASSQQNVPTPAWLRPQARICGQHVIPSARSTLCGGHAHWQVTGLTSWPPPQGPTHVPLQQTAPSFRHVE